MTKKEALLKIDELLEFVNELEEKKITSINVGEVYQFNNPNCCGAGINKNRGVILKIFKKEGYDTYYDYCYYLGNYEGSLLEPWGYLKGSGVNGSMFTKAELIGFLNRNNGCKLGKLKIELEYDKKTI